MVKGNSGSNKNVLFFFKRASKSTRKIQTTLRLFYYHYLFNQKFVSVSPFELESVLQV